MPRLILPLSLVALLQLSSCAHYVLQKRTFSNPSLSPPELMKEDGPVKKVFIASVNNFNGQTEGIESLGIQIGGLELTRDYLEIVRKKFGERSLVLSTGNFLFPNHEESASVFQSYIALNFDAYGLSHRELAHVLNLPRPVRGQSSPVFINSNIFDLRTSELLGQGPLTNHQIFRRNGINIGLISVAPAPEQSLAGYFFEDPTPAILRARTHLIRNQAQVLILMLHHPSGCFTDPVSRQFSCESKGMLNSIIERLPAGSIDIVLTTGEHHASGLWKDVFVSSSPGNGLYLKGLVLAFDTQQNAIDHSQTTLLQPTLLCQSFFQLTEDCYIGDSRRLSRLQEDKLRTIPARFLDESLAKDK
jgi:hypothetical protein